MSWIVRQLLSNRDLIKQSIYSENQFLEIDFSQPDYENLLLLESKITEMKNKDLLSDSEIEIIDAYGEGKRNYQLAEQLDISRTTLRTKYKDICTRIAFYIGGLYTDMGYINYMTEKHNLDDEQKYTLSKIILGEDNEKILGTP